MLTPLGTIVSAEVLHQPQSSLADVASAEVLHQPLSSLEAVSSATELHQPLTAIDRAPLDNNLIACSPSDSIDKFEQKISRDVRILPISIISILQGKILRIVAL